jgi:HEAT repeat protein
MQSRRGGRNGTVTPGQAADRVSREVNGMSGKESEFEHETSLPRLMDVLVGDEDQVRRVRAAKRLGEIGDVHAIPALIEALRDKNLLVRMEAARALGEIGDAEAVSALIGALRDESDSVQLDAAVALNNIGTLDALAAVDAWLDSRR